MEVHTSEISASVTPEYGRHKRLLCHCCNPHVQLNPPVRSAPATFRIPTSTNCCFAFQHNIIPAKSPNSLITPFFWLHPVYVLI